MAEEMWCGRQAEEMQVRQARRASRGVLGAWRVGGAMTIPSIPTGLTLRHSADSCPSWCDWGATWALLVATGGPVLDSTAYSNRT